MTKKVNLIKQTFTQNMIPTQQLFIECFPPCLLLNIFLQVRFCKFFYRACCGISSHKACCGWLPTSLFGLAYNSKSCFCYARLGSRETMELKQIQESPLQLLMGIILLKPISHLYGAENLYIEIFSQNITENGNLAKFRRNYSRQM